MTTYKDSWLTLFNSESLPPPPLDNRWTAGRKAAVVQVVKRGEFSATTVCNRYNISEEEFSAWMRDFNRGGVSGLMVKRIRTTRLLSQQQRRRSADSAYQFSEIGSS
jgi:hypothetical protein